MTHLHRDENWSVVRGDTASMVVCDQRIFHTVSSRYRDIVTMVCGAKGQLRRYWTQAGKYPVVTGAWKSNRVSCVVCLAEAVP